MAAGFIKKHLSKYLAKQHLAGLLGTIFFLLILQVIYSSAGIGSFFAIAITLLVGGVAFLGSPFIPHEAASGWMKNLGQSCTGLYLANMAYVIVLGALQLIAHM
ncbi:MAG: hypothetical protein FWF59_05400 [Turicibacter sp.]|nr:hypothetical protein [Turicibacter sp.]